MKLISEEVQNAEYLIEEKNGKKEYKIKGVFLQSNIKNKNGRVYPREILVREVNRYTKEFINKNSEFKIDKSIQDKILITAAPDGYLKRVK